MLEIFFLEGKQIILYSQKETKILMNSKRQEMYSPVSLNSQQEVLNGKQNKYK